MLQEQIKNNIKEAMLARDSVRLEVMRGIYSAFTNDLVAKGKKPQDVLSDEEALAVITRLSKQRKDSIEQFKKGVPSSGMSDQEIRDYLASQGTKIENSLIELSCQPFGSLSYLRQSGNVYSNNYTCQNGCENVVTDLACAAIQVGVVANASCTAAGSGGSN